MHTFMSSYYNNNHKKLPTTRIDTSNHKTRSQSFSSFSHILEETSPTATITSCSSTYSLHHSANHMTRSSHTDFSNTSNSSHSKRFHSSHLGRPPGSNTRLLHKPPIPASSASTPLSTAQHPTTMQRSNSTIKIAPMKEVEKMIADLKKENFDLKLRLYHLEDLMTKELDIYQLNDENCRLKMNLEDRNKYIDGLERELTNLLDILDKKNTKPIECTTATQTEEVSPIISPATQAITEDSYHTAFESSPEAFGLLPVSSSSLSLLPPKGTKNSIIKKLSNKKSSITGSWQRIVANDDHISSVVKALQKVKIDNNSSSSKSNNDSDSNTNIVDKWLNQNVNDHQQGNLSFPIS